MGMGLKKSLNLLIAFSVVLGQCEIVLAYESEKNNKVNLIEETKEIDNENNKALVTDVYIKGIYENSVLYTGAEIKIEGSTDKDASNQNISWNVTGNNGNIEFESSGNKASIIAKKPGSVWIMARATDGSYKSREYTVKTENYPKDQFNQFFISKGIRPVLRRKYSNSKNILMVEIEKNSTGTKGRVDNLKSYLNKLTKLGDVRNFKSYMDNHYEYFIINAGNEKIEFRLDRKDESYSKLKTILVDVRKYSLENNVDEDSEEIKDKDSEDIKEEIETDKENNKEPNIPSNEEIKIPSKDKGKDEIISDDNDKVIEEIDGDKIVNLGGEGSSEENPIIITVNESLQTEDKIEAIDKYIEKIKITNNIYFIRKYDTSLYTSYIFKISKRREMLSRGEDIKNDFFIEIRVKKDDKESYKSIIEMLDKIDNKEDEESKAGENIESEKETSKEIEDSKSNIKDENSNDKMDKKEINNSKSEKNKENNSENKINEVDLSSNRKKVSIFIISTGGLFLLRKKFRNKG